MSGETCVAHCLLLVIEAKLKSVGSNIFYFYSFAFSKLKKLREREREREFHWLFWSVAKVYFESRKRHLNKSFNPTTKIETAIIDKNRKSFLLCTTHTSTLYHRRTKQKRQTKGVCMCACVCIYIEWSKSTECLGYVPKSAENYTYAYSAIIKCVEKFKLE